MFVVIWTFRCMAGRAREFESAYGPDGGWAALFSNSPEYLGTELLRGLDAPDRYMTIDRWRSREAYTQFLTDYAVDYDAFDGQCEGLTEEEERIGGFDTPSDEST